MSRLTIELTREQHQQVKAMAAVQGKSIKDYMLERLFPLDEQQAWHALQTLLTERVGAAEQGEVSEKTFEQIVEET